MKRKLLDVHNFMPKIAQMHQDDTKITLTENHAYKLFPNLYIRKKKQHYILFNPLYLTVAFVATQKYNLLDLFISGKIGKKMKKNDILSLLSAHMLVEEGYDYMEEIDKIRKNIISSTPFISNWYVFVANDCNLDCRYCFIKKNLSKNFLVSRMSRKTAECVAEYIAKFTNPPKSITPSLIFFGGEPLLNFESIKIITNKLNDLNIKNSKIRKGIITNGTLLSVEKATFLIDNEIKIAFSIDGPEKIHNKMRVYSNGRGSFKDTMKGFNLIKELGVKPSISCTVGPHNYKELPSIAEYFVTKLEIDEIGFNIMREGCTTCKVRYPEFINNVAEALIKSFNILKEYGVYENTIGRILSSLIRGNIRKYYCAGYGYQLVIATNGDISPCPAFVGSKQYCVGNVYQFKNPMEHKTIKIWKSRSPFNMPQCYRCPAISICGGGCAYQSYLRKGSIWEVDADYCKFCKSVLDYFLDELYLLTLWR